MGLSSLFTNSLFSSAVFWLEAGKARLKRKPGEKLPSFAELHLCQERPTARLSARHILCGFLCWNIDMRFLNVLFLKKKESNWCLSEFHIIFKFNTNSKIARLRDLVFSSKRVKSLWELKSFRCPFDILISPPSKRVLSKGFFTLFYQWVALFSWWIGDNRC